MTIKVAIRFIDGSVQDMQYGDDLLRRLESGEAQGLTGKQLIFNLLASDDWGRPIVGVEIGAPVKRWIPG